MFVRNLVFFFLFLFLLKAALAAREAGGQDDAPIKRSDGCDCGSLERYEGLNLKRATLINSDAYLGPAGRVAGGKREWPTSAEQMGMTSPLSAPMRLAFSQFVAPAGA